MLRAYSGEASFFLVFGLTRLGLEPTIYHTRGEHANHYATDEVNRRRDRQNNGQMKNKKGQIMIFPTLHKKPRIVQSKPH